ncbi:anthrone oxygenase family protein [Rhodococcus sp. NPDC003382]
MLDSVSVVTVVVVGLLVGVEFAVAVFVNPMLARLPGDGALIARSDGARVLGRVMPFWYIASTVLGALWSILAWGEPHASLVIVATALLVLSVVMSVVLLVPINNRVAAWAGGGAPDDWQDQVGQWDRYHYARVAVLVGAFVLLVVALA